MKENRKKRYLRQNEGKQKEEIFEVDRGKIEHIDKCKRSLPSDVTV